MPGHRLRALRQSEEDFGKQPVWRPGLRGDIAVNNAMPTLAKPVVIAH